MDLPLDILGAIARRELATSGSRPLFTTVSGAHLYGFPSPDSDFDVRGAHLLPLASVLSLNPPPATCTYSGVEDGREIDFVSHDAGKFFALMLRRNGYVLEQVFSPLVIAGGAVLDLHPREGVRELIARKRSGAEKASVPPGEIARHREALASLRVALDVAAAETALPDAPAAAAALDDLLIRLRLGERPSCRR